VSLAHAALNSKTIAFGPRHSAVSYVKSGAATRRSKRSNEQRCKPIAPQELSVAGRLHRMAAQNLFGKTNYVLFSPAATQGNNLPFDRLLANEQVKRWRAPFDGPR
jgi:hypothetical protein